MKTTLTFPDDNSSDSSESIKKFQNKLNRFKDSMRNRKIAHSNDAWSYGIIHPDINLVDYFGQSTHRPCVAVLIDVYSGCVMGFNLSLRQANLGDLALTLRHAILPKSYDAEYQLYQPWETYGLPKTLITDGGKDLTSTTLKQLAAQLEVEHLVRMQPSEAILTDRFLTTLDRQLFQVLPGYTGSSATQDPCKASLTLRDLHQLLMRYIANYYNQCPYPHSPETTRLQRWVDGLTSNPVSLSMRELDICLPKAEHRRVYVGGHFNFSNLTYHSEYLAAHAGESISLRYLPMDISSVAVYQQQGHEEIFLGYAGCLEAEGQPISVWEAIARQRHQRCNQDKA